jgi:coenzyme F420-dependent glucose-6-phosphate dehydrogenase
MPPDTRFWFAASTEEFAPTQMLEQARAAERAGFDGLASSDHFAPWFPEGKASQAWIFLAALGQLSSLPLGTSVTPIVHHYHPGLVAQAFMSLEELYPGRVFLGAGSGEALNEVPLGCDWPAPGEQVRRLDEGLEAIRRLWDGETVTMDAGWFRLKEAKLYTRASGRPRLYVSAFGAKAARVAADEQAAVASAKKWKPTQMPEVYRADIHDPAEMVRMADRRMSDEQFAHDGFLVGADAGEQVERLREMRAAAGASVICLQLIGDADPLGSIRRYGEEVLPPLGAGQGASGRRYSTSSRPSPATSSAGAESRQPSRS